MSRAAIAKASTCTTIPELVVSGRHVLLDCSSSSGKKKEIINLDSEADRKFRGQRDRDRDRDKQRQRDKKRG